MIRSHKALFISVALIAATQAQPVPGVKDLTERMQRRYDMIDDVTALYDQHVKLGYANVDQDFKGRLVFKKPKRYRLESDHQTLVTDGSTVWAYTPANKQVIIDAYKEQRNSVSPEEFLLNLPSTYYSTVIGREVVNELRTVVLKLTPKDDRSFVKSVRLWLVEATAEVKRIQVTDQNETQTTYHMTSIRMNTNVPDTDFQFIPPPGTDVVDLR